MKNRLTSFGFAMSALFEARWRSFQNATLSEDRDYWVVNFLIGLLQLMLERVNLFALIRDRTCCPLNYTCDDLGIRDEWRHTILW